MLPDAGGIAAADDDDALAGGALVAGTCVAVGAATTVVGLAGTEVGAATGVGLDDAPADEQAVANMTMTKAKNTFTRTND